MSVEVTAAELKAAKEFIEAFVRKTSDLELSDVDNLPKKPASFYCTKEEVKGECLHIAFAYLCDSGASDVVSSTIAHQATEKVLELDFTSFEAELKKDKDHDDNGCDDNEKKASDDNDHAPCKTAYDCGKLAMETIKTVHRICQDWQTKMPTLMKSQYQYEVYAHSEQNTRRKMEDKHIVVTQVNNLFGLDKKFPGQAYFAVFDGHGGIDAALYTVAHLHNNIFKQDMFVSDLDEALNQAFMVTDKMFLEKANIECLRAGTTGVVAILRGNTLHIGWLGDSQVTLCKRGMAVQLMEPHKPNRKDERQRIEDLGGCVVWFGDWRVNGNIAVSRSIGDRDHKPYVSGDPDTVEFDLEGDEEYMILACDGLWDTIHVPDVVQIVEEHLAKGGARSEVAKLLVESAIEHGSTDNITVVIVFLDCHKIQTNDNATSDDSGVMANGVTPRTQAVNSVSNTNSEGKDRES